MTATGRHPVTALLFTSYHERGEKSIENQEKPKRKTHTSSEVKRRYNAKTYTRIALDVRNEIATAYKEKCSKLGISYSAPLHKAIEEFLAEE